MKYIQNRKIKGLSGSVFAAIVASVLLLAGSTASAAEPGALAQSEDMQNQQEQQQYDADKQENIKHDESQVLGKSDSDASEENPFGGGPIENTGKVKDYAKFVLDESTEYTVKGLKEFTKASKSFIQQGEGEKELKKSHKELEKAIGEIKKADGPRMQAERASQAFKDASQLFTDIQEQSYPQSAQVVQPVKSAAEKIKGDQSLAMQLGEVQNFFVESGKGFTQLAMGGEGIGGGPADEPAKSSEPGQDDMNTAPAEPTDSAQPVHEDDNMGGGPSHDDGAAPSGY